MDLGLGRTNDQGMYNDTGLREYVNSMKLKGLADGGYTDKISLIVPDDEKGHSWNQKQKSLRSIVECVIGYVHSWGVATERYKGSTEMQEVCLLIVYELANRQLKQNPLGERRPG